MINYQWLESIPYNTIYGTAFSAVAVPFIGISKKEHLLIANSNFDDSYSNKNDI